MDRSPGMIIKIILCIENKVLHRLFFFSDIKIKIKKKKRSRRGDTHLVQFRTICNFYLVTKCWHTIFFFLWMGKCCEIKWSSFLRRLKPKSQPWPPICALTLSIAARKKRAIKYTCTFEKKTNKCLDFYCRNME